MEMLRIDCGTCAVRGPACGDCMVTALLGADHDVVEFCSDEVSALRAMTAQGMLPPLRLVEPVSLRPTLDPGGTGLRRGLASFSLF